MLQKLLEWFQKPSALKPRLLVVAAFGFLTIVGIRIQKLIEKRFRKKYNIQKKPKYKPNPMPRKLQNKIDWIVTGIVLFLFGILAFVFIHNATVASASEQLNVYA